MLNINPVLNLGASLAGYVKSGNHALNAYDRLFIMPITIALSSASAEQISLAQVIESGPTATDMRFVKYANHFKLIGIVHIPSRREDVNPKNNPIDITKGRLRRWSLRIAKKIVVTSWIALCPVGMTFCLGKYSTRGVVSEMWSGKLTIIVTGQLLAFSQSANVLTLIDGEEMMKVR